MNVTCIHCPSFRTSFPGAFHKHLLEESHSLTMWPFRDSDRLCGLFTNKTLVVTQYCSKYEIVKPEDLLHYFSYMGPVVDFYFSFSMTIIQLDVEDIHMKQIAFQPHMIGRTSLHVRLLPDVPPQEWQTYERLSRRQPHELDPRTLVAHGQNIVVHQSNQTQTLRASESRSSVSSTEFPSLASSANAPKGSGKKVQQQSNDGTTSKKKSKSKQNGDLEAVSSKRPQQEQVKNQNQPSPPRKKSNTKVEINGSPSPSKKESAKTSSKPSGSTSSQKLDSLKGQQGNALSQQGNPMCQPLDFYKMFYMLVKPDRQAPATLNQQRAQFEKLSLDVQLRSFIDSTTMLPEDLRVREDLVLELGTLLRERFPSCILYPFGSMVTLLGDSESDIDVFVDVFGQTITQNASLKQDSFNKRSIMAEVRNILRRSKRPRYHNVVGVFSARVPIIKLVHNFTNISVDLSFENLLSQRNTQMIAFYLDLDARVRPLMLVVRYWGRFHNLTGSTAIKSYALVLLVLLFLMKKRILPTVWQLQDCGSHFIIDGWNAGFCRDPELIATIFQFTPYERSPVTNLPTATCVLSLAQEFFEMLATTDFSTHMACPLIGDMLERSFFEAGNEELLPETLEPYKIWSSQQTLTSRLNVTTPLVIQDPFLLSFNVGGVASEITLKRFQLAATLSSEFLKKALQTPSASMLLSSYTHLPVELRDKKFLRLQRIHVEHQRIANEIKSAVGTPTSPMSIPEDVPYHRIPLSVLTDRKSIRYGKGWESYSRFGVYSPNKRFCKLFLREFQRIKGIDKETLNRLMGNLWLSFVVDLLKYSFKAFDLTQVEELTEMAPCQNSESKRRDGRERENPKDAKLPSPYAEALIKNLQNQPRPENGITYTYRRFVAISNYWTRREVTRDEVLSQYFPQTEENEPVTNELKGGKRMNDRTLKLKDRKDKKKAQKEIQKKIDNVLREHDPLKIEEQATALGDKTQSQEFALLTKIDDSSIDGGPEVYFFTEPSGDRTNYIAAASVFKNSLDYLIPYYVEYRFLEWLRGDKDPSQTHALSEMNFDISSSDSEDSASQFDKQGRNDLD